MIEEINVVKDRYEIAGLKILMTTYFQRTLEQSKPYVAKERWKEEQADFVIDLGIEYYKEKRKTSLRNCDLNNIEYIMTGTFFNHYVIEKQGAMLHSSAVAVDGYGYLFSANSGTGKSTHTELWLKHFGKRAFIINDDKPVLIKEDGNWFVYGTPWSGKHNANANAKVKLGAIVFIERAEKNWIEKIDTKEAIPLFFNQTIRKIETKEEMDKSLTNMGNILKDTDVYKMGCNISNEAVWVAYNQIRRV